MDLFKLLLLFQALFTFFFAGGLFFKENSLTNKSIALFFVLFALEILYFLYGTNIELVKLLPMFMGRYYFSVGVVYGPIFFIHLNIILKKKKKISLIDGLHLIPLLILFVYMFDLTIMPDKERAAFYIGTKTFYSRIFHLNYVRALHQIIYGIILFVIIKRGHKNLSLNDKFYVFGIFSVFIVSIIFISFLTLFASGWGDFYWYYILSNAFTFFIIYTLYKDPSFFKAFKSKYSRSTLNIKDKDLILNKIENYLSNQDNIRDQQLNLNKLANSIDEKKHHISQTLSEKYNKSFNDLINEKRIEYSKKLLLNPQYDYLKILAVAMESGFTNKTTFNRAFVKYNSSTPSQFRKERIIK